MEAASILTFNDAKGSYVLGSGVGKSIKDLVQIVFSYFNLDWDKYVVVDNSLLRSGDPKIKFLTHLKSSMNMDENKNYLLKI